MAGLGIYRRGDEPAIFAYLDRRPYDNVYVSWLLHTRQIGRDDDVVFWRDGTGSIQGVAALATRIMPCTDSPKASVAFAREARARVRDPRMIVGRKNVVDAFWHHAQTAFPAPRIVRTRQPVYALTRTTLRGSRSDAAVARARTDEVEEIAPHAARMTSGELGFSIIADAAFHRRTANIVEAGWYWRLRVGGRLAFMCHVGARSAHTAQIHGVWTPPAMRGRGYATHALAAICDRLLDETPSLCLYVNDFNDRAIALYERVGFAQTSAFSTIVFG